MKKVKTMLFAVGLFAMAAGTFAFKTKYGINTCTVTAIPVGNTFTCQLTTFGNPYPITCNALRLGVRALPENAAEGGIYCTTYPTVDEYDLLTCPKHYRL